MTRTNGSAYSFRENASNEENRPLLLLDLRDEASTDKQLTGGKASNLARLFRAGFPVPPGLVFTTTAAAAYASNLPDAENEQALRERILSVPLKNPLKSLLLYAAEQLSDNPLAVRSSGVAEDSHDASFAGLYDTFLNVEGAEQVELAVRKCLASSLGNPLLLYRKQQRIGLDGMAVLIQPMLVPDAAGVAFTANPVNGDRGEIRISAVRGLGERLVSGSASPDEWLVRGDSAENAASPESAIDAIQVLRIAELARKTEAFFGEPQDIEWAISGDDLYLLQARPITTLHSPAEPKDTVSGGRAAQRKTPPEVPDGFWEREASHYPDPLSPATRTTFVPAMNHAMRLMCSEMSLMIETLEQRSIGGWMYQRTVPLGGQDRKAPPNWLMPLLIRTVPSIRARIAGAARAVREEKNGKTLERWSPDWKPELIRCTDALRAVDLQSLTNDRLRAHLENVLEFLKDCLDLHMRLNGALQLALAEFAFLCRDKFGWSDGEIMSLFDGLSQASSAPARAMSRLARRTESWPKLRLDLESGAPLPDLLLRYPDFAQEMETYLDSFGNRALRSELAYPTLAESPELLAQLLRQHIRNPYEPEQEEAEQARKRAERLKAAEELLQRRSEADKLRFRRLLTRAELAYAVREEHGFHDRDAPFALLRYALLEAGRRLTDQGRLDRQGDVFLLEFEETSAALRDEASQLRPTVRIRQEEMNQTLAHPGPASYGKLPPPPPSFASFPAEARLSAEAAVWAIERIFATGESGRTQTDASLIRGIPSSSGRYAGKVRIVRDESEFGKIRHGDILVCPITTPAWSVLFPSIGALVTDSGGILSHSAIIAREYSIPSVVATGNATTLLRDGQRVIVDGGKGTVEAVF